MVPVHPMIFLSIIGLAPVIHGKEKILECTFLYRDKGDVMPCGKNHTIKLFPAQSNIYFAAGQILTECTDDNGRTGGTFQHSISCCFSDGCANNLIISTSTMSETLVRMRCVEPKECGLEEVKKIRFVSCKMDNCSFKKKPLKQILPMG